MRVILNMNCRYGEKGQEVNIPDDILSKYPKESYKEIKKAENKAILEPKETKWVFSKKK